MAFSTINPQQYKVMKNTLIITTDNDDLVSSVDDGTNTLFINDTEIPSNQWVGTGNYTTTVEGHNITIAKIASLTGNIMIERVSSFSYRLVTVKEKYPVYQDASGNVTVSGNITDGSGNILSNKVNKFTIIGNWNGSASLPSATVPSATSVTTEIGKFTLPQGIYLVIIFLQWSTNANGRRYINFAKTSGASEGNTRWQSDSVATTPAGVCTQRMIFTLNNTEASDWYLNALQNSGSSLTALIRYNFVKIG